ncbi:MAG: restriction endonuclease subunit S [Candidatus Methanospirareceae archaeon]
MPEEWDVARLRDVAKIRGSKNVNNFKKVAFIPMELISDSQIVVKYQIRERDSVKSSTYCEAADLLLAKITPSLENGKQGIVPSDVPNGFALATTEVFPISCEGLDKFFLFYILKFQKFRNKIISSMTGTTGRQRASKNSVENLKIPLPPLPEQRRIAEILTTADTAIQKVGDAIAKTERLKGGLMQELLTKGIGHEEFKDSEVGRIPKGWEVVKLEDVLELCQYGLSVKMSDEGKYPIVRMDEIEHGNVVSEITKYVDLDEKTLINFKLEKGDILFNRTNSYELVGRTGIFLHAGDYVFASYLIRLRPKHEIVDPLFLTFYLIFSNGRLRQLATRAVHQANINATNLKKFKVSFPEKIEEQRRIAEILSTLDKKLELERKRKEKLERIKKGLMNNLLTGKRRVKP